MAWKKRAADLVIGACAVFALTVSFLAARNAGVFGGVEDTNNALPPPHAVAGWNDVLAAANWIGPRDARVVVVEFADFECPFCAAIRPHLDSLRRVFSDTVAIAFLEYPLIRVHPSAFRAALIAECGALQGRFASVHDQLFGGRDSLASISTRTWAERAGIPQVESFESCVTNEVGRERVEHQVAIAHRLGIRATPTIAVNGILFAAGTPLREIGDSVRSAVHAIAKRLSAGAVQPVRSR